MKVQKKILEHPLHPILICSVSFLIVGTALQKGHRKSENSTIVTIACSGPQIGASPILTSLAGPRIGTPTRADGAGGTALSAWLICFVKSVQDLDPHKPPFHL